MPTGAEMVLTPAPNLAANLATVARLQCRQPLSPRSSALPSAVACGASDRLLSCRRKPGSAGGSGNGSRQAHGRPGSGRQGRRPGLPAPARCRARRVPAGRLHYAARLGGGQLFATDGSKVQIWLPNQARQALQQLGELLGMSASDVVANSLSAHLYGRLAYEQAAAGACKPSRRRDGSGSF